MTLWTERGLSVPLTGELAVASSYSKMSWPVVLLHRFQAGTP
jgi:hypothetical protein